MPSNRGTRVRIASGVYRDRLGVSAQLMVRGRRVEKRFPADTPLRVIRDWRDGERLRQRARCTNAVPGTLQADVVRYLLTARAMPSYQQRAYDLAQWVAALGPNRPRDTITATDLDTVMATWEASGLAPQTVKLRRTALRRLYNVLDGKDGPNVVRRSTCPQEPGAEARGLSLAVVLELFEAMPASEWRPRLKLLAFAGLPPKLLGQVEPSDVSYVASTLKVKPRKKGKGTAGSVRPITPQAVAAFRELDQMDAWGPFKAWRQHAWFQGVVADVRAARVAEGFPPLPHIRPYDLRHSFGTWLYEQTHDLATVARLLGVTLATARRYALGAVSLVDVAAVSKLGAVIGAVITCPNGLLSVKERPCESCKIASIS